MKKFDSRYILYLIFVLAILYMGYSYYKRRDALEACTKYSLATPKKLNCKGKTGTCNYVQYSFHYNDKEIIGEDGIESNAGADYSKPELMGKKFFVKFSCTDPNISEICWEIPALDDFINVPSNGWDKLPSNY